MRRLNKVAALAALPIVSIRIAATATTATGSTTDTGSTATACTPVIAHTEYKWVPDVTNAGPAQWTLDNPAANTKRTFDWKGTHVSYHRDGTKSQFIPGVTCAVNEPTFNVNTQTCSVTIPYTKGIETRLYGVNGYSQDVQIDHDVTVKAGLDGADGTAPQFWIGYTAQPGYVDTNAGAGTTHIDFYNGDLIADCVA